ncbi:MAG TPA: polyprenyl synthetase family protein [Bacteroidia bacterium]|nr:polyprenyl synthetase family protein [Bacteroidia bacterium]
MELYKELLSTVNSYIQQQPFTGRPAQLYDPINYMMQLGGKRVRPVLTLMGCKLFGGDTGKALPVAVAVEVFHNFTLVHDDIMDKAPIRRGQPTVHIKWNPDTAILSGDLMMIKSMEMFQHLDGETLKRCLPLFLTTAAEVCEGQQIDMNFETAATVSVEEYLHMIELKTAVLLACSLKLGAYVAGSNEDDARHLYNFGKHIGIAFQLQDDILDAFGDTAEVGKQKGGDIIANKKTYLLIKALEQAKGEQKATLYHWLNQNVFNEAEKVTAVLDVFNQLDVKAQAEAEMKNHLDLAHQHLNSVGVAEESKNILAAFAGMLQQRVA